MVTTAKGSLPLLLFNLRNILNHRLMVFCITALLAIYVAWQAGSLVWKVWLLYYREAKEDQSLVWKVWLLDSESPQAAVVPLSSGKAEPESLQNLLRYPLIQSGSNSATGGNAAVDQPQTSLNLKLVGLMYSLDANQARAIIENPGDGARSYSIYERVADNAEIHSIEPDRVILLHAGRQEALMLDPEQEPPGSAPGTESQPTDYRINNQAPVKSQAAPEQSSANTSRKLDDLMRDFSATPVMEEGELVGFRLAALRDPGILNDWGIDPSDVITAVNGMPLNSQGRVMVLYNKLKKAGEFELTLDNGGNSRTITVEVD